MPEITHHPLGTMKALERGHILKEVVSLQGLRLKLKVKTAFNPNSIITANDT